MESSPSRRSLRSTAHGESQPRILARACQFCKTRKAKCNNARPRCGTCITHKRHCIYSLEPPKKRPSARLVNALREEKAKLTNCLSTLKAASLDERSEILDSVSITDGQVYLSNATLLERGTASAPICTNQERPAELESGRETSPKSIDYNHSEFLSLDEHGHVGVYGPSSALHGPSPARHAHPSGVDISEIVQNRLIANAALQRQKEHRLRHLQTIGGEPSELAMHLLELHWSRQHHTFLLTYRPAIMRDLVDGGPSCSDFLLNAIFACVSKYSDRIEVRDDPDDSRTAGRRFFTRCEQMLGAVVGVSSIPTVIGLLLLGSTFNARGLASKGWLFTGYALRMVHDLGLHLNREDRLENAEENEIRRRVFWGAFVCDKLQSLYLGRSVTIQLQDAHISREFLDTFEEHEAWTPYMDPRSPISHAMMPSTPIFSVSTFQQLCLLSKIMTKIINRFYVIGATAENTMSHLQSLDIALEAWYKELPPHLVFEPWATDAIAPSLVAPNVVLLLTTYNALVVLLHRPFIFDGHLKPTVVMDSSRQRCSVAARNITTLATSYQNMHSLRGAPYLLSYAVYVACTIHARDIAATEREERSEYSSALVQSLQCLDEMTVPNSGIANPAGAIRRLAEKHSVQHNADNPQFDQLPCSTNFDALCRMFPPTPLGLDDVSNPHDFPELESFGHDIWQDFIDAYIPSL